MAWYRTGTITVTNGSTTVTGSGTSWIANAGIGEALYAPDGRLYEIANIASNTSIILASAYLGTTASAQTYVLVPSQSYIRDLAAQAADLVNNYATIYNTIGQSKFPDGTLAEPGIRFNNDLDTGFFRSAANEVTFVAGGVAQFKYDTSGVTFTTGGALVGATATQTLTNKTISADNNTLSGIAASSFVLSNASGNIDGSAAQKVIPAGVVVGTTDTQTLTNKTISADNNTLSGIAASSFVVSNASGNIDGSAAQKVIPAGAVVGTTDTQTLTNKTLTTPTITGGTVNPTTLQENGSPVVVQTDIGTAPNEIPLNQYLGSMAYQDRTAVNIGGGVATLGTATVTTIQNDTAISNVEPSLMLNFAAVEALDPRITYTRASTATYYNGVTTAVAEQNLLLQSQTFDNASWVKSTATVTANTEIAPDGTTTADTLTATTDFGFISQTISAINAPYTFSVWIKRKTGTGTVDIRSVDGAFATAAVTSSWTRFETTITPAAGTKASQIRLHTNGDEVYIWGAQLEQRSAVSAYTPTTTQPITNYIPVLLTAASGVPRFDHNPISGDSLGFLVEQQSTNLVLQSQTFDSATWIKNGGGTAVTVIPNTIIAPDGTLTGDKLDEAAGVTQNQVILQGVPVANSTAHTFSFYAKAAERSFVYTQAQGANNFQVVFNLTTGTVGVSSGTFTSATITPVGNNWYRCAVTATSTTTNVSWYIEPQATNALGTHLGVANNGIFLWGAQLEATAFPTSYIATVASQVTRAADAASMTGTNFSSWFNNGEGAIYQDYSPIGISTLDRISMRISDGGGAFANDITFRNYFGTNTTCDVYVNGVLQGNIGLLPPTTVGSVNRVAMVYKFNDFAGAKNGGTVQTDTSGILPVVNQLSFPSNGCNYIKKFAYYPRRLSNEELQEMTS